MKKRLALGLAAVLAVSTLAGCGGGSTNTTTAADSAAETTAAGEQKPAEETAAQADNASTGGQVEITWWAFPTFAQDGSNPAGTYEQEIIDAFQAKNPDITVKLETIDFTSGPEKITAAIEAGTVCDVLFDAPGRIISYAQNGKLVALDDMFTDDYVEDVGNEALLNSCKSGDSYYMYPISTAAFCMAVSKNALEEAGAMDCINQEGDRTWTTAQFEEMMKKLNEAGFMGATVYCSGQGGDQGIRAFVTNLYKSSVTDDAVTTYTINDEGGVKAMTKIKEWVDNGYMLNGSAYNGGEDVDQFVAGNTAFTTLWSPGLASQRAETLTENGIEVIALPFPSEDGVPALEYLVNGFCVFDNGDAARAEASKKFIDFICNDEEWGPKNVVKTSVFPVRQSMGDLYSGDAEMNFYASLTKYYSPYYNTIPGFAEMRTYWFPMLQAVINGDSEPKAALDDFVAKANQSIENAK
ncbi:MAG: extracellular solute-binding protein [Lachnospiraceae bacterium]|nr:extracellular solute-binding protein [Lachnospiraceae bacterium]